MSTPRVAFVLGGGGVLGATQVGMLRALATADVTPDVVVGTSIGALNGAFVAADPSEEGADRLAEVWQEVVRKGLFTQRPLRQVAKIPRNRTHVLSHAPLQLLVERYLPVTTFEQLTIPFQCVAAEIEDSTATWFDSGSLAPPVLASCSVPGLFPPVQIDGRHYLDGGLVHSIPVGRALSLGAQEIFVLQVGRVEQQLKPPTTPWQVASVAFEISRRHRFVDEIASVPDEVALHILPSGANAPTVPLGQVRGRRMRERMDAAYEASIAYLHGADRWR